MIGGSNKLVIWYVSVEHGRYAEPGKYSLAQVYKEKKNGQFKSDSALCDLRKTKTFSNRITDLRQRPQNFMACTAWCFMLNLNRKGCMTSMQQQHCTLESSQHFLEDTEKTKTIGVKMVVRRTLRIQRHLASNNPAKKREKKKGGEDKAPQVGESPKRTEY